MAWVLDEVCVGWVQGDVCVWHGYMMRCVWHGYMREAGWCDIGMGYCVCVGGGMKETDGCGMGTG